MDMRFLGLQNSTAAMNKMQRQVFYEFVGGAMRASLQRDTLVPC
jgi:hypothetical protein